MNEPDANELPFLWVTGALDELRDLGLIEGGDRRLSPAGRSCWDQVDATGYRPSDDEVSAVLAAILYGDEDDEDVDETVVEGLAAFVIEFCDRREQFLAAVAPE